jgi:hypothetical protein
MRPETKFLFSRTNLAFEDDAKLLEHIYTFVIHNKLVKVPGIRDLEFFYRQALWSNRILQNLKSDYGNKLPRLSRKLIETYFKRILETRKLFGNNESIPENSKITVFANNEKNSRGQDSFANENFMNALYRKFNPKLVTRDSVSLLANQTETVNNFTMSVIDSDVLIFSGHGYNKNPKEQDKVTFFFNNGKIEISDSEQKPVPGVYIDSEILAKAIIARDRKVMGKDKPLVIFLDGCMQGGIAEQLQKYFDVENDSRIRQGLPLMNMVKVVSSGEDTELTAYYKDYDTDGFTERYFGSGFLFFLQTNPRFELFYDVQLDESTVSVNILNFKDEKSPKPKRIKLS